MNSAKRARSPVRGDELRLAVVRVSRPPKNRLSSGSIWGAKADPCGKPRKTSRSALQPLTSGQRIFRFRPMLERTSQNETRYTAQRKPERTRPNSDEVGATPPFDAPCVTASVGSLPPQSRAARDPFSRVPEPEFRTCKTTSITPRKGESKDTDQSTRKTADSGGW